MAFWSPLTIPRLQFPIAGRSNIHIEAARASTWKWVRTFDLIRSASAHKEFAAAQIWDLVARCFPDATVEDLSLICDWQTFMHIQSEQFAEARVGRSARRHQAYVEEALRLMRDPRLATVHNDGPLLASLNELWTRTSPRLGAEMSDRFLLVFGSYLMGYLSAAENRRLDYLPTQNEYLSMRRNTSGFRVLAMLAEMTLESELPMAVRDHHIVSALHTYANDAVSWVHDIYRMQRFAARNDTHHIVAVVRQQHNLLPQEALNRVGEMINEAVGAFIAKRRTLPDFPEPCAAYIDGMEAILRGLYDWLDSQGWLDGTHAERIDQQQS